MHRTVHEASGMESMDVYLVRFENIITGTIFEPKLESQQGQV